jgi:malectin (di-glucose binding ER protein)
MAAPVHPDEAKAELGAVLSSGVFAHAPSLAQFLSYVCNKSLEGQANQIKEYNIAVEALGRLADFDQKRDSIVRVEAHRLRKRLRQYYASDGASHTVQILIPPGQYVPQFVYASEALAAATETGGEATELAGEAVDEQVAGAVAEPGVLARLKPRPVSIWSVAAATVLVAAFMVWQLAPQARREAQVAKAEGPQLPLTAPKEGQEIRILAGSSAAQYVDRMGNTWTGDRFFSGGDIFTTSPDHHISGTLDPVLFQSRRQGAFSYDIPLKPGSYELHLYFAETLFGEGNIAGGGETYRIFDVMANGKTLLNGLDVVSDAGGGNVADVKVFKDIAPDQDGFLHLKFMLRTKEIPFLNAIEILPGIAGKLRPVRIVARETSVNAKDGRLWSADRYFVGGQHVLRADPVRGTPDPELYMGERYGNFTYSIPVAPGRYTLTLRFSESWFGPKKPAGGGPGERLFDVYANGVALLRNFDVYKEAGGEDRALDKVFHSLAPNAQGKIVLSFVPVRNYACINAIEVLDES